MTEFAVATVRQAQALRQIRNEETGASKRIMRPVENPSLHTTYAQLVSNGYAESGVVTPMGRLALELREALGPDRGLTKAGAKALMKGAPTRATKLRLMEDGLWKHTYLLGVAYAWLTEDGRRIREILIKHRAEV